MKELCRCLLAALLTSTSLAALPDATHSARYSVTVDGTRMPVLKSYEKSARKLDRDRDRVLSPEELASVAKELPGNLQVDLDDFCLGLAHEYSGTTSVYTSGYPSVEEIDRQVRHLSQDHPDKAFVEQLGLSPEGRSIISLRLAPEGGKERPKIVVVAQQHAREWMAHQVALATLSSLLENPANQDLLSAFEFWIVPLANPDGYEYSRSVDPMWRKNRRQQPGWPDGPRGVDLNRNFSADFRTPEDRADHLDDDWGASDRPYSAVFRGSGPASEPETQLLQSLLDLPGVVGVVDLHGFGCKIVLPDDNRVSDSVYGHIAEAMKVALGPDYQILRFADLYPITGHLSAYADQRGIPAITLEVGRSFQPHPSKMQKVAADGARGVIAFARSLMEPPVLVR